MTLGSKNYYHKTKLNRLISIYRSVNDNLCLQSSIYFEQSQREEFKRVIVTPAELISPAETFIFLTRRTLHPIATHKSFP